ncbi:MAG: hypothetical protein M1526_05600 [Candidatus Thermoplasmatota archaeon]|jgi:hypothetical protein|nr:hypothetical protein [Candidatus Thermoplasmatota archaeon]
MTPNPITATVNRSTRGYWIGPDRRYYIYDRSLVDKIEDIIEPSFLLHAES